MSHSSGILFHRNGIEHLWFSLNIHCKGYPLFYPSVLQADYLLFSRSSNRFVYSGFMTFSESPSRRQGSLLPLTLAGKYCGSDAHMAKQCKIWWKILIPINRLDIEPFLNPQNIYDCSLISLVGNNHKLYSGNSSIFYPFYTFCNHPK